MTSVSVSLSLGPVDVTVASQWDSSDQKPTSINLNRVCATKTPQILKNPTHGGDKAMGKKHWMEFEQNFSVWNDVLLKITNWTKLQANDCHEKEHSSQGRFDANFKKNPWTKQPNMCQFLPKKQQAHNIPHPTKALWRGNPSTIPLNCLIPSQKNRSHLMIAKRGVLCFNNLWKLPSYCRAYDVCCRPLRNPKDQNLQRCRSYALRILNTTCWDKHFQAQKSFSMIFWTWRWTHFWFVDVRVEDL